VPAGLDSVVAMGPIHFRCTLHLENQAPGKYREIAVVRKADHFELIVFGGALLRRDQLMSVQHD
jgi:hypothetical protein